MFEKSFDSSNDKKFHHVGYEKYKVHEHDFSHFLEDRQRGLNDPKSVKARNQLVGNRLQFVLVEPERLNNPVFNVLHVRTQKPGILRVPFVKALADTWGEAVDMLKPLFRFGVPESSLKDKCKYWREDNSPLPGIVSLQTQRMLKTLDSEYLAQRIKHTTIAPSGAPSVQRMLPQPVVDGPEHADANAGQSVQATLAGQALALQRAQGPALTAPAAGAAHGHGHGEGFHHGRRHLTTFQAKEEFIETVTPWVVFSLNVAAWMYLGASSNKPGMV